MRSSPVQRPRAAVFDFDGTLMDSLPLVIEAYNHALAPFGQPPVDRSLFVTMGAPPERWFSDRLGGREADVTLALSRLNSFFRSHGELSQPYAGALDLLRALKEAGVAIGVWTGRDRNSAEAIWRRHGFDALVSTAICGDDLDTHKPAPEGLVRVLELLGVTRDEALYAGDADVDVEGGHAVGVRTILITHGRTPLAETTAKAWRIVAEPTDAYHLIRVSCGVAT